MNKLFCSLVLFLLTGCSSLRMDYLGNRLTCTVAKDKAYVTSLWGWIGISSEIVSKDAKVICNSNSEGEKK